MADLITEEADLLTLPRQARELLFTDARTPVRFTDEPVTDEHLDAIYELFKWAPTSANSQPLRIVYVRTPGARERLVARMNDGNKEKTAAAPLTAVLAADLGFHQHLPRVFPIKPDIKDAFETNDDARQTTAKFNAAIQIGYFVLAIRAAGLGAGPMTGFDAAGVDTDLFPDGDWASLAVVNIGNPIPVDWGRLPRLDHDEIARTV